MRRLLVVVAVEFFVSTVLAATPAPKRGAVDWIFLVDTSKSMSGFGGSKNIFADVQASLKTFVNEASDGDSVTLYTFDKDVEFRASSDIRSTFDRDQLNSIIDGLKANGTRTHLGAAIAQGLEASEKKLQRGDATRQRAVVLFTDGKEDVQGIPDPVPIPPNVQRVQKSKPWIFFVSMGADHEAKLDDFANDSLVRDRTKVIKARDASAIADAAREIRQVVQPPPEPPKLDIKPPTTPITPSAPSPPLWRRLLAIGGAILVALLLAAIGVVLYTGKMPGELIASLRNTLEGEIEILQPRIAPDAAFIGLPKFNASEIALSSIVPLDVLAGSDARLYCRRSNGSKKTWIAAQSGPLRVNDIETPQQELFDSDTIRIGDATLRFNRIGYERPSAAFEGEERS